MAGRVPRSKPNYKPTNPFIRMFHPPVCAYNISALATPPNNSAPQDREDDSIGGWGDMSRHSRMGRMSASLTTE